MTRQARAGRERTLAPAHVTRAGRATLVGVTRLHARRLPAPLGHRPLQPALRVLHARRGRAVAPPRTTSSPTRSCWPSPRRPWRPASRKVRVTGGEPLVRKGFVDFVERLAGARRPHRPLAHDQRHPAAAATPPSCARAGLQRVNVSIDSLDAERYARSRAAARLADALAGLDAAFAAGFAPVKVNAVLLAGVARRGRRLRRAHARGATCTCASSSTCRSTGAWRTAPTGAARLDRRSKRWRAARPSRRSRRQGPFGLRAGELLTACRARWARSASSPACPTISARAATACASRRTGACKTCLFSAPSASSTCGRSSTDPTSCAAALAGGRRRQALRPPGRSGAPTQSRHVPDRRVIAPVNGLSHLDEHGRARMVDVGDKPETAARGARPRPRVRHGAGHAGAIRDGAVPKGDVLATARLAGIMAAKRTHELIPLCHPLAADLRRRRDRGRTRRCPACTSTHRGAPASGAPASRWRRWWPPSVAALTVYDMCKAIDRGMEVTGVRLLEKAGGAQRPLAPRRRGRP